MLKRSVVLVLAVLYVITVSGFAMNLHYCFNRLSSVNFNSPANSCAKLLAISKMKCCSDKHVEVKVKDAHESSPVSYLGKIFSISLPVATLIDFSFKLQTPLVAALSDRGPPPLPPATPLFLKNCIFRI